MTSCKSWVRSEDAEYSLLSWELKCTADLNLYREAAEGI